MFFGSCCEAMARTSPVLARVSALVSFGIPIVPSTVMLLTVTLLPDWLTLLGNRHVGSSYAGWPVRVVRSYRPGNSAATRFLAMNAGRTWPRLDGREFVAWGDLGRNGCPHHRPRRDHRRRP